MGNHKAVEVDPKALAEAEKMWANFIVGGKLAIAGTCAILVLLALMFVKFF